MNAGYYNTTLEEITAYRSNLRRFLYTHVDDKLIASLWFVDANTQTVWNQTHVQLPSDDPDVMAAIHAFPAMEIK